MKQKINNMYVALASSTSVAAFLIIPLTTHAAFGKTKILIGEARNIIDFLIPSVVALALLFFFWGLAQFILHADSEDAQEKGKNIMKWGIVALFVMVSIWGITGFIGEALFGGSGSGALDEFGCLPGQRAVSRYDRTVECL